MTEVIAVSTPVPEAASAAPWSVATEEWRRLTGALLHEIDKPEVQSVLMAHAATPVSETLPGELLSDLPSTPLLSRLQQGSAELSAYAALPPVEDSKLAPDLREAWWGHKISKAEFDQVAQRYAMARDVKLLALGAELRHARAAGNPLQPDTTDTLTLPSGITIHGKSATGAPAELLDPTAWESREQLKDRVYLVTINGKEYILKEQKTARHTDTVKGGHRKQDVVSPAHEFEVGQKLLAQDASKDGGVQVKWERPLGYVVYPDGFQFGVYAYEEGLESNVEMAKNTLRNNIIANPEAFAEEFAACNQDMQRFIEMRAVQSASDVMVKNLGQWALRKVLRTPRTLKRPLTFEDFAEAKALQMVITATWRQAEARNQAGLVDLDDDGTLYRVPQDKAELEIVGLDYERYEQEQPKRIKTPQQFADYMAEFHQQEQLAYGPHSQIPEHLPGRMRAAVLSLLERSDPRWVGGSSASIPQG